MRLGRHRVTPIEVSFPFKLGLFAFMYMTSSGFVELITSMKVHLGFVPPSEIAEREPSMVSPYYSSLLIYRVGENAFHEWYKG